MTRMGSHVVILGLGLLAVLPGRLHAQTFTVQATVVEGCALVGSNQTSGLDFGTMDFGSMPAVLAGVVPAMALTGGSPTRVWCTPGVQLQMAIDAGIHESGGQRFLARAGGGSAAVPYGLYADSSHATPIPAAQQVPISVPLDGFVDLPVYGLASLPGGGLLPGQYGDVLHVTLSW